MKILHLLPTNSLSGAENVAADICIMLGGNVESVYCSPKGTISNDLNLRNVKHLELDKFNYREIKRVITEYNPDIVHAHDVKATLIASLVTKRPLISHLHVNNSDMNKINLKSLLYLFGVRNAKKIIMVSDSCLENYKFKDAILDKTIVLNNVIATERIDSLIQKNTENKIPKYDFIFLGRLAQQKNPVRVAKVASEVLKKDKTLKFAIIGEGNLKNEMRDVFLKECVINRVDFLGKVRIPYTYLKKAKALLMCSKFEGTPIAALESLYLGVPIVSTPVDGMKSLVKSGKNGFLSDENEMMVEELYEIIKNNEKYQTYSENSKELFGKLNDQQKFKEEIYSIYKSSINT